MTKIHKDIVEAELHEPKGVSTATSGSVYTADGAGSGTWTAAGASVNHGVWDYNDLATTSTPIPLTLADTFYDLTNDGAGAFTNTTYKLDAVGDIWNVASDRLDFSGLSLGDIVEIRVDVEVTTGAVDTEYTVAIELGLGGSAYTLEFVSNENRKSTGAYKELHTFFVYMGDTNTLDNLGKFKAKASKTGTTVIVNGWAIVATPR